MIRLSVALAVALTIGATGCSSDCDNAGVSVDGRGNIVVSGETGFVSPNSTILKNVAHWPASRPGEQNVAFSQGYALSRDGRTLYLLANTATHPNLVYRIDLGTGKAAALGSQGADANAPEAAAESGANASSNETSIVADDKHVYSVDQAPVISRASLSSDAKLVPYIAGKRTRLRGPIGVAVGRDGKLCALDGETLFVLCYAPSARGNVAPVQSIDTKATLGYGQVDDITFGRHNELVVAGTSDSSGLTGFSIAVFDVSGSAPRRLRTIAGPKAKLQFPDSIAVDGDGNIVVLQGNADLAVFGPSQRGNTAPIVVRDLTTTASHPFRMAIDRNTGDIAILAADGVFFFSQSAKIPSSRWLSAARHLPLHGWDIAFGPGSLIVANEFGTPISHALPGVLNESSVVRSGVLDLQDPEFISTDQAGNVYAASTNGVVTALPPEPSKSLETRSISFRTPFGRDMAAFAADAAGYYYFSSTTNNAIVVVAQNGSQYVMSGARTGLNQPIGLAVARDGTLFVANSGGNSILEFARGSHGDSAPVGQIEGASTGLIAPQSLAIDSAQRLYVFDGPIIAFGSGAQHYVRVYDAGKRGDVSPLKSYIVQTKCWLNAP